MQLAFHLPRDLNLLLRVDPTSVTRSRPPACARTTDTVFVADLCVAPRVLCRARTKGVFVV